MEQVSWERNKVYIHATRETWVTDTRSEFLFEWDLLKREVSENYRVLECPGLGFSSY